MKGRKRFHGRNLRKGRHADPGRAYLVTAVTKGRRPVFDSFSSATVAARSIHHIGSLGHLNLCFVVMPDHIHWLFRLGSGHDLARTVAMMKNLSARRLGMPVWQRGFHDHAVRDGEDIREIARYVVANPIRAGLVEKVGDYPFWDAVWLDGENNEVW